MKIILSKFYDPKKDIQKRKKLIIVEKFQMEK
jgi:hypothetical protein